MNQSFLMAFKSYFANSSEGMWNLWIPLLGLLTFVVLFFPFSMMFKRKQEGENKTTVINHLLSSIYSAGVWSVCFWLIISIILLRFSAFFGTQHCQLGSLINFLVLGLISFFSYLALCRKAKNKEMSLVDVPLTGGRLNLRFRFLKKKLNVKILTFILLAGIPFFIVLLPSNRHNLVSIVFDNSISMEQSMGHCVNSLREVLTHSPHKNTFVLSTVDCSKEFASDVKSMDDYFNSIVEVDNPTQLPSTCEIFNNTSDLLGSILQKNYSKVSLIYSSIWQNYLTSFKLEDVTKKKMIVISDGADMIYLMAKRQSMSSQGKDIFQMTSTSGITPYEFYEGEIYGIALPGEEGEVARLWNDCAGSFANIYDGLDQQSFYEAFVDIMPEMFFDRALVWAWAVVLFLILVMLGVARWTL